MEREAVYVALRVTPDGGRQVLGFWLLPTENASAWEVVLRELWGRGLRVFRYAKAQAAGIALHHRWTSGDRGGHPAGVSPGPVAAVWGAPGEGQPEPGAVSGQGFPGPGPAGGLHGGKPKGGLRGIGAVEGGLGGRCPALVAAWWENSGALLRFYGYPRGLWPYLRSTNLMERFIREVRRGTKVRDHKFPRPEAVFKLLSLEGEGQEGRWAERKLKGFAKVREVLERMLQERYAPRTSGRMAASCQTRTHNS